MNTQRSKTIAAGIMVIGMIILGCTSFVTMGPGSETVAVAGRVVDSLGRPVSQTPVMLLPSLYNPQTDPAIPDSMRGITDEAGDYTLKAPGPGAYSVEAADSNSKYKSLITGITIKEKDTVRVPESVLRATGTLRVVLQDTISEVSGYVYLPGTTCLARARNGSALIDGIPSGFIPAVYYANMSAPARNHVIQTNLTVLPKDTAVVADVTSWKYSKKLYLNTTARGAGVGQNVYDFPLLVRLNNVNFTFSQALINGEDIRFTKENGSPLAFEVEHWDPVTKLAEVWVKVDTIHGNDSAQSLIMYWGNGIAATQSNAAAVFDTARGFQGVWHLNEAGSAIAKDATGNHYDGMPSDTAPAGATGEIGPCRSFNGSSNFIRMNGTADSKLNFQENGIYTLSAWTYADTLDIGYHMIAGKNNEQYFLGLKRSNPDTTMRWEFVEYHDKGGWQIAQDFPAAKTWTYLVGVRKGAAQYLYVNGVLADSTIEVTPPIASRNTGDDVTIGSFYSVSAYVKEGKCPFLGKIDEVRISNAVPSADWIKLCYMNQKAQDALVVFK